MADSQPFRFKRFAVEQASAAHPVGTDGVLLGAWADVSEAKNILDIGTGTGLVALMLAQRNPVAQILGVEIHAPSAACAARNFANSDWSARLSAAGQSVQDFAQSVDFQFDAIVSNPPFFSESVISPVAERQVTRHIGSLPPADLLAVAQKLLAPCGRFSAILPKKEGQFLCELAAVQGLFFTKILEIRSRPGKPVERVLLEFRHEPLFLKRAELTIHATDGGFSDEFRRLTGAFYLGF